MANGKNPLESLFEIARIHRRTPDPTVAYPPASGGGYDKKSRILASDRPNDGQWKEPTGIVIRDCEVSPAVI